MSAFSITKTFHTTSSFIPFAIEKIQEAFCIEDGYSLQRKEGTLNKTIVEISKGNWFGNALGLGQYLEISFSKEGEDIQVHAKGDILKKQALPSFLSGFVFRPILIPQVIGLVRQARFDDAAMAVIESAYQAYLLDTVSYCPHCGRRIIGNPGRCPGCGSII